MRKRDERPALRAGIAWAEHAGTTPLAAALEDSEWLARLGGNLPPNPAVQLQQAVRLSPSAYRESTREVVENLRAGRVVILDLATSEHETAARLIDFCSAFTLATRGLMQQLTSTVLVLTPPSSSAS
ncbi:cell division protein SepF [Amycolatopsis sp. lyj-84]|uniref:cell division protein SepF n=1 Tax=Amycolatopsis sp. lyj-84 TaxID=2789284 RepID=UPI003978FEF9